MKVLKNHKTLALLGILVIFSACENMFEFSPYESDVKTEYENTTIKNLQLLKDIQLRSDTFSFAFIADNHYHYDNLKKVISDINKREDILFTIIGGDIADRGLLKEYEIFHDIMKSLDKPYFTVIGNHDYRSNGEIVYKQMYGELNYSFEFNQNKFVFFDNVVWESNKNPDFDWLSKQLKGNKLSRQVFVIGHIPPFGDQFTSDMEKKYSSLMHENNVTLSLHGHVHSYYYRETYNDSVNYLTAPWLKTPTYCIVKVFNNSFDVELVSL